MLISILRFCTAILVCSSGLASWARAETPGAASVQPLSGTLSALEQALDSADEFIVSGRYHDAIALLEQLGTSQAPSAEIQWRLGKALVDLGGTNADEEKLQKQLYSRAVRELREAVLLDPNHRDSVFNLAVAVGREAMVHGTKEKVRASHEVKELVERTIEIDPEFDGGYHLLGRWHREIKSMGFFARATVKLVYGGLPEASLERALSCFEQAYALRPRMVHLLEIGISHEDLGNRSKAREVYQQVVSAPSDHVESWKIRAEARRRLAH